MPTKREIRPSSRANVRRAPNEASLLPARSIPATLVVDQDHYDLVVRRAVASAQVSVWISTANLKATMVEAPVGTRARARGRFVSLFETLADLKGQGVEVRILHAAPPSRPLAVEMRRLGARVPKLRQCPRVHLKMIAIDGRLLYIGSANLTGAGIGAKGEGRRNFEMGILTESDAWLDLAQERFDRIWRGAECAGCRRRRECPAPIDRLIRSVTSREGSPRARRNPSLPRAPSSPGP
jgi:phosphatidylserine/phosphatidylglycerophosphate/cardiolipin synthase-like enzyme